MARGFTLALQILDGPAGVSVLDPEMYSVLRDLWSPFVIEGSEELPDLVLEGSPGGAFVLERDHEVIERTSDPWHMLLRLKVEITAAALDQRRDMIIIHSGGVVSRSGGALLIVGHAGAGKTTLSTDLARTGLEFMGDDLVAIDRETLEASPIPRPPAFKGSVHTQEDFFDSWRPPDWLVIGEGPFMVPAPSVGPVCQDPIGIERLIFPRHTVGSKGIVRRLSTAEAATILGEQTHSLDARDLAALLRICRDVEALAVEYSTTEQALEHLT